MNLDQLWNGILELTAQLVIPVWNDLIQYIPWLGLAGLIAFVAVIAWMWQRNGAGNRSRVPRPVPAGRPPEGLHLPGPSPWPFVAPVGLFLIVFSLALGPFESFGSMALLALGLAVGAIGVLGWYLDANREYVRVEAGGHGAPGADATGEPPGWSLKVPEGMHLPGPSAWPFLAPVGLLFMVGGLIFGPAMLIGGLVMAAVAAVGWLVDANRELDDVETHGHPTQSDRDPEKAWPRRLIPVYFFVGGLALLLTLLPWLISLLPGSG